jgi:L-fucose/D-arabinose isomerase
MQDKHKKIGLISTMSPDKTWAKEVLDRVAKNHTVVKKTLAALGFEVCDVGPLHRSYQEMTAAGKELRFKGINALVLNVGTWTYANCAAAAALEAQVPVLILPDATPGTCGLVGGAIARGAMSEFGVHSNMVYGPLNDKKTLARIKSLLDASCAVMGLRGQIMGFGGGRSMGMVTAVCDPNEIRLKFGVEIDSFEQLEIIQRAEEMSEGKVKSFYAWMEKTFGKIIAKEDVIYKQIRLYFALEDFANEKGYDFLAVKCLPELPAIYTTFCLCHAIMGDGQDARGPKDRMMFACEADLNAAMTMQILKLLAGGPVMFTDLTQFDFKANVLTTCNCGSQPTDFAASKKDVHWEIEGVHEFKWKYGGTCPQHVTKPGRATVARLSRNAGSYEMLIAPVEVVKMPREKLKETIWERPHAYLKLLCDRDEFFGAVRSNHIHLVYDDWSEQLTEACRIVDVKPIVLG